MLPKISLVTATADRPVAFALCEKYMSRQTYGGEIEWIVADGGRRKIECTLGQTHLHVTPNTTPRESFRQNLIAALNHVSHDRVLFIEDDDWYHPGYVAWISQRLNVHPLVGESRAKYYNVRHRMWRIHPNTIHASLCQTGIRAPVIEHALDVLRGDDFHNSRNPQQLDGTLWKRRGLPDSIKYLEPESRHVVGIKGVPGRPGLGIDHTLEEIRSGATSGGVPKYRHDPSGDVLASWIGREDAEAYRGFAA